VFLRSASSSLRFCEKSPFSCVVSYFPQKTCTPQTLPFYATKTTTTDPMGRRIILKVIDMKKNNGNNGFNKESNEKQNSFASEIRIGLGKNFPILKQKFVKIKEAEYSTEFEFFIQNQVHVVVNKDKSYSIGSSIEKRAFEKGLCVNDDALIYKFIETIHRDIISFKYGGELVF
jgi:Mg2+ and Co2+ transporter CorA